jgi:RNA polymerase sigma factor (sigma-70 family)
MSEAELIKGCLNGERSHFNRLYECYSSLLYGICLRYADDEEEAKDVLQEAFVKIFKKLDSYTSEKGSFEGWIKTIVRNLCIDYCRKRKYDSRIPVEQIEDVIEEADEENEILSSLNELTFEDLAAMISELPAGYRMVFNLYVIDGLSHKEISNELNISENTSKTQLMKAKNLLKKRLKIKVLACTK